MLHVCKMETSHSSVDLLILMDSKKTYSTRFRSATGTMLSLINFTVIFNRPGIARLHKKYIYLHTSKENTSSKLYTEYDRSMRKCLFLRFIKIKNNNNQSGYKHSTNNVLGHFFMNWNYDIWLAAQSIPFFS